MAKKKSKATYEPLMETYSIKFTSRASVKVGDSFYTVEACEERVLPFPNDNKKKVDFAKERELLWDCVNTECDNQIQDILRVYKK